MTKTLLLIFISLQHFLFLLRDLWTGLHRALQLGSVDDDSPDQHQYDKFLLSFIHLHISCFLRKAKNWPPKLIMQLIPQNLLVRLCCSKLVINALN